MRHEATRLTLAIVATIACGPTTQFVGESLDGGGGEGEGESEGEGNDGAAEADGATGSFEPAPVGDGCAAPDCAPQVLWIHALPGANDRRITVDTLGRPMWVDLIEDPYLVHVLAYDPATDTEHVVGGPFESEYYYSAFARDGPEGLRVLRMSPQFGAWQVVRLDGPELSWSYDDFDGSFHPSELERGPDGTSYVLASNGGPDEVRLYAIANDGSLRWRWELEPQDDGFDGIWFGTIAVHPAGMTIYERRRYPPEQYQWMGLRVEDDELVSEVDIALDHPASEWLLPTPFEGGWLGVSDNRYGGVARLGKLDAAGALDWYREDSATTGWVYGWAANESRIVLVTNTDAEDSNVFVRSYELDGQLRGSLTLDLSVQTDEPVFPEGWGNAAFSLPDGTIVVQVGSVGGTWLVGMRA